MEGGGQRGVACFHLGSYIRLWSQLVPLQASDAADSDTHLQHKHPVLETHKFTFLAQNSSRIKFKSLFKPESNQTLPVTEIYFQDTNINFT